MSRFTEQRQDMYGYFTPVDGVEGMACVQELGEIEDILYAPDGTERITLEALKALVDGYADGRLVVLPCKVGDTVYVVTQCGNVFMKVDDDWFTGTGATECPYEHDCEFEECDILNARVFATTVRGAMIDENGKPRVFFENINEDDIFGQTVFLTRAEAEAALKEGGQDDEH